MPDQCTRNTTGKVKTLIHRINDRESVEIRIKTTDIEGEMCPWSV
ncbi:MAG TPA: hypothetical protein PLT70_12435 [bacterium]|nr:hypothetical protein [bacterium]